MLTLNINESRTLEFEVQISGINPDELKGNLTFEFNNITYGFPVKFNDSMLTVDIPPLKQIVNNLNENIILKSVLEINGNGYHLTPWAGDIKISNPVMMEAKINDETNSIQPEINISQVDILLNESDNIINKSLNKKIAPKKIKESKKQKKLLLKNVTKEQIYKFMAHMGSTNKQIQDILYNQAVMKCQSNKPELVIKELYKVLKKKK